MAELDEPMEGAMGIGHISDTARWVAVYRAMESERPDALFRDPWARRLAGPEGEAIVAGMPRGAATAWSMIVRTAVMDELLAASVGAGADLVLNLAAGLDARPWRLDLPSSLRWVDVDLPGILAYKQEVLADATPGCRYEAVAADLADADERRAVLARASAGATRAVVLTEGLLIYLTEAQVGALATDLAATPGLHEWIIDLASPFLLRLMQRMGWTQRVAEGGARMQFAPVAGVDFFRPFGWRARERRSTLLESRRLDRRMAEDRLVRLFEILMPWRRKHGREMSQIVLLGRNH